MKFAFALLSFFACVFSATAQNQDCYARFRTGTFVYAEKEAAGCVITRNKKTQTEVYNDGASKMILDINWLNDSMYTLKDRRMVKVENNLPEGTVITTTIKSCDGNKFVLFFDDGNGLTGTCTMIKLEDIPTSNKQ